MRIALFKRSFFIKRIQKIILLSFFVSGIHAQQKEFIRGADISWLQEIEAGGGIFHENGNAKDAVELLRDNGFNFVRLRIWHTPINGINGLDSTLKMAMRVKKAGMKLLLDFHFSDWWADPGKQTKPEAWKNLSFTDLRDSVQQYVFTVFRALKLQSTLPAMVQFGNEVICGMLWPDGYTCNNTNQTEAWERFVTLLKAADQGMKNAIEKTDTIETMMHIDRGGNYNSCVWFYDNLAKLNYKFDIIGLSYYSWWHGSLAAMKTNIRELEIRYHKEIILAEIAYPFTLQNFDGEGNIVGLPSQILSGYPATVEGQTAMLSEIISSVKQLPNNNGRGIFYWEPAAITAPRRTSHWENLSLFSKDGEPLTSIKVFNNSTSILPQEKLTPQKFDLMQNFPNPFNPTTTIQYSISSTGLNVTLKIYDALGREISTLVNEVKPPGNYSVEFNGAMLSSGNYFIKLQSGLNVKLKMITLLR